MYTSRGSVVQSGQINGYKHLGYP